MKTINIRKADLTKDLREKICFIHYQTDVAQGDPGLIAFITNDGNVYWFNCFYGDGDITEDDAADFFPELTELEPDGWKCEHLQGIGRIVLIAEGLYDAFMNKIKHKTFFTAYTILPEDWMDTALQVISDAFGSLLN